MKTRHKDNQKTGMFYLERDGEKVAEMTYYYQDGNTINIDHTEVDKSLRGEGIGTKLMDQLVMFVRNKNLKVVASCPYAKSVLEKNPAEYQDIIK